MQSEMVVLDPQTLKQTLKEALVETFHEERGFLYEIVTDVLEDFGMSEAIRKGRETELVDRDEVFSLLESAR